MNHLGDHAPEVLDLAVLVCRTLHRCQAGGDIPDFLALIADALEVGNGLDNGDYHSQVAGSRRAGSEDAAALLVDGDFHVVDLVVIHRHGLTERAVAFDECGDGLMALLLHKPSHAEHLTANSFEVYKETAREEETKNRGFHQLASPVPLALRARMRA